MNPGAMNQGNRPTVLYPIDDGFLYDTQLKCDLRFLPLALHQFEALRRSKAYGQRILTIPEDPGNTQIPAFGEFAYAQRCKPGSAFWAYSFLAPTGLFSVNLRDNCSDEVLFSEVLLSTGNNKQVPLPKLLIVGEPGLINCQICSIDGTSITGVQFLLWGGEPRF
jgi:hypothetical protein